MSTPPTWPAPDQDRPDPFAVPAPTAGPAPFEAPADAAASQPSPYGPPAAAEQSSPYGPPAGAPASAPYPVAPGGDRPGYGGAPTYGAPAYGAPATFGAPTSQGPASQAPASPYNAAPPYGAASPYNTAPPYGGPPTQPPYGGPTTPGQPYGPGGYYPPPGAWGPPQPPVDGLAIASLVTSGVGLFSVGATGPIGLGLGIAALVRIRRSGARGRGLAIGGIVTGGLMTLMLAGFIALMAYAASQPSSSAGWETTWDDESLGSDSWPWDEDAFGADVQVYELAGPFGAGQCLDAWPEMYDMSDALLVDCAVPHSAEVIGTFELSAAPWDMGVDPAVDVAWEDCWAELDALGSPYADEWESMDVYYPHPSYWADGETTGYCVAISGGSVTGSAVAQTLMAGDGVLS
ncbi:DUF4190 domain-containing protein [Cellulomonas cellasea]|uniref:DUF4190 domain-containing protein n=1 Tax=Cellulomonas cellasea TaxID=43670 RepID=UPI0025A4B15C|nr:DUF4190 domain-containing protein [Cellulomonas cellasea]MDM8084338.1 DUF4190 domain-containing protein [Cellulomonas cellasea]